MDLGYQSFCAVSRALNCDTVSQSPYAVFLSVPVAVWGVMGYLLFFALLAAFKLQQNYFPGIAVLCVLSGVFTLISISLAFVSTYFVHSYCIMCIVSYAVNLILFMLTWMAQKRFGSGAFLYNLKENIAFLSKNSRKTFSIAIFFVAVSLSFILFYPKYWRYPAFSKNPKIEHGVTDEGSPWIGALNPEINIVEFTDYMCFQCGKMHSHLRRLISEYPEKIRLIHRHFPLDRAVNPLINETVYPKSGMAALFAIFAQERGMFWKVNDILFRDAREKRAINLGEVAKETGLYLFDFKEVFNDKRAIARLENDIQDGIRLGIHATPSYEINGNVYIGTIPADVLSAILK